MRLPVSIALIAMAWSCLSAKGQGAYLVIRVAIAVLCIVGAVLVVVVQ